MACIFKDHWRNSATVRLPQMYSVALRSDVALAFVGISPLRIKA